MSGVSSNKKKPKINANKIALYRNGDMNEISPDRITRTAVQYPKIIKNAANNIKKPFCMSSGCKGVLIIKIIENNKTPNDAETVGNNV